MINTLKQIIEMVAIFEFIFPFSFLTMSFLSNYSNVSTRIKISIGSKAHEYKTSKILDFQTGLTDRGQTEMWNIEVTLSKNVNIYNSLY